MFAVQIGFFAWLDAEGLVTTSARHAMRYHARIQAESKAGVLRANPQPALVHIPPRLRAVLCTTPVTVIPAEELDERLRAIAGDRGGVRPPVERDNATLSPSRLAPLPSEDKPTRAPGITRQIYNWTLANPQATKADALAAWPSANPSTVSVQFSAARRAGSA